MSRFDRVDVSLGKCCIGAIQSRVQLAVPGDRIACLCGQKLTFDGRWRAARDEFRASEGRDSGG